MDRRLLKSVWRRCRRLDSQRKMDQLAWTVPNWVSEYRPWDPAAELQIVRRTEQPESYRTAQTTLGMDLENFRKQVNKKPTAQRAVNALHWKAKSRNSPELNSRISEEANNPTLVLKGDSKMQGDWGEMILKDILDRSRTEGGRTVFLSGYAQRWSRQDAHNRRRSSHAPRRGSEISGLIAISSSTQRSHSSAYMDYQSAETPEVKRDALHRHAASPQNISTNWVPWIMPNTTRNLRIL